MSTRTPASIAATEFVLIGSGTSLEPLCAALTGWFTLGRGKLGPRSERVYYDTFDGLLYGAGVSAFTQDGRLTLTSRDASGLRLSQACPSAPRSPLDADTLSQGRLREQLEAIIGPRVLLEIARVRVRAATLPVLDELAKTVVRLHVADPDGMRPRISVAGMRGYDRALAQVTELLADCPQLCPAERPLVDEAVLAGGGDPRGRPSAVDVELFADERADVAAARVLRAQLEVCEANLPGVIEDLDIEFLHDFRVSLRRTRAVVREMREVFPKAGYRARRAELRWLQVATGPTRDLDVYLAEFEQLRMLAPEGLRGDLDPLLEVLREHHMQARIALVHDLRSARARTLLRDWGALIDALPALALDDRPGALHPIGELSARRIRRVHRRMVRMGRAIKPDSPPHAYHDLRKLGKELRYLLELFGRPLHDPEVTRPLIRALKELQDVLGRHQDREVQVEMLRRFAGEVALQPGGADALLAMGAMLERLEHDAAAARAEYHARFHRFASKHQRRLVRETFDQ